MADIFYFAVYPTGQAEPTAAEIVGETVSNGFFGSVAAAEGTVVDDGAISGLAGTTTYTPAVVFYDGTNYGNVLLGDDFTTNTVINVTVGSAVLQAVDVGVKIEYDIALGEMAIYWVCYPASQPIPEGGDIINETVSNGVHASAPAPLLDQDITSPQFTGLTVGEFYRISAIPTDGINTGVVWSTETFQTFEINDINITVGEVDVAGVNISLFKEGQISVTVGAVEIAGVDTDVDSSTGINVGAAGVTIDGYNISVGGSTWIDVPDGSTTWVNI